MKNKLEDKERVATGGASGEEVDVVRGDTQIYGVTAPDPSRPQIDRRAATQEEQEKRNASLVSFGDKKIDMEKMRDSYLGEVVAGRFTITEFIDRGGMGEVYLGVNEAVGQRVAVKFLSRKFTSDESIVTRFGNEAKSYARVTHPNAVTLLDYGQHDDGALYIITEFVDGKSLSKTIKQTGPFTPQQVISIGQQCCDVLTTAHSLGVIHRDLKPDNIMLIPSSRDRYTVKILDFGIAKLSDDEHGSMTETGAIFGTPEFMSPEQARGDGAEPRSDLYALGVILYYMLSGKLPFSGKNKFAILNKHLNDPPPRLREIAPHIEAPAALEAVIFKCLNKRPQERYATSEDLYGALEEVREQLGAHLSSTTSSPPSRKEEKVVAPESAPLLRPSSSDLAITTNSEPELALNDSLDKMSRSQPVGALDASLEDMDDPEDAIAPRPRVQLGEYAERPGVALNVEIDDLAHRPQAEIEEEEEWEEEYLESPAKGRLKLFLGIALVLAVIGGAAAYLSQGEGGLMTRVGDQSIDAVSEAGQESGGVGAREELERILITSQVLGLLASAEQALEAGDIASTRRQLETSKMWLGPSDLPERGRERRQALEARLETLTQKERELKQLRADNACDALGKRIDALQGEARALSERWRVIQQECVAANAPAAAPTPVEVPAPKHDVKREEPAVKAPINVPPKKEKDPSLSDVGLPDPSAVVDGVTPDETPPVKKDTPTVDPVDPGTDAPNETTEEAPPKTLDGLPPKTL